MKKIFAAIFLIGLIFLSARQTFAKIGVGVATGKIIVQEKLKPGILYHLPPLTVVNTGDEDADYQVVISYFQNQPQLEPQQGWFIFSPQQFHLKPGKVQVVDVALNLPINAQPGNYFAYLEAHPIQVEKAGVTTIGIAAAAKLYFTIVPANIFQALYYKITSFWTFYSPWTNYALYLLVIIIVVIFAKKYLNIQVNLKKSDSHNSGTDRQNE